jgi:hypothetical protein
MSTEKKQNSLVERSYNASRMKSMDLGVWKVFIYDDVVSVSTVWTTFKLASDVLGRLVKDVFALGPVPCCALFSAKVLKALQPSLDLYQSSQFLKLVSHRSFSVSRSN